jgi:hypothetical protein
MNKFMDPIYQEEELAAQAADPDVNKDKLNK